MTFDSSESHIEALKDGTIDLMLVQDPARLSYEAVKSLALKLQGQTITKRMELPVREIVKGDLDKPDMRALLTSRG